MKLVHLLGILVFAPIPAAAQCEMEWLAAPPEAYFEQFGQVAVVNGDTLAVGTPHDDVHGHKSGSVFVFGNTGGDWAFTQFLAPANGAVEDHFGDVLDIVDDTMIIGARNHFGTGILSGVAYVYERIGGTWVNTAELAPADSVAVDQFTFALSLEPDRLLASSVFADVGGAQNAGAAYIFERSAGTWAETAKLVPGDPILNGNFGSAVVLDGERAFVGALGGPGEGASAGVQTGAVYVYELVAGSWVQTQKLNPSDGAEADRFGNSLWVDGATLFVGSPRDDDGALDAGSVYVFEQLGGVWVEAQKLTAFDGQAEDEFGHSVGVLGETAMVGARSDDDGGSASGAVYRFQRYGGTWYQNDKLVEPDAQPQEFFGNSIWAAEPDFLLTATRHDDPPYPVGATWLAPRQGPGRSYCESAPNSAGAGVHIGFQGSARISQGEFALVASGGPPGRPALFYYGGAGIELPFGNGFRCVGAGGKGIFRLGPPIVLDGEGAALRAVDFEMPPADAGPGAVEAGTSWYFQLWYRDPDGGGALFNLSDGLALTFCP